MRSRVGHVALILVVIAPLCGIALYDVFVWWAGRRWGTRLAEVYTRRHPRAGRAVMRAENLVRRRGVWALAVAYYLPIPNALLYLSCGASEMPLWAFVVGDALGTLLWEALLLSLGWTVGHDAVRVVSAIDQHATDVTLALVVGWLAVRLVLRARGRRAVGTADGGGSPPSLERRDDGRDGEAERGQQRDRATAFPEGLGHH